MARRASRTSIMMRTLSRRITTVVDPLFNVDPVYAQLLVIEEQHEKKEPVKTDWRHEIYQLAALPNLA